MPWVKLDFNSEGVAGILKQKEICVWLLVRHAKHSGALNGFGSENGGCRYPKKGCEIQTYLIHDFWQEGFAFRGHEWSASKMKDAQGQIKNGEYQFMFFGKDIQGPWVEQDLVHDFLYKGCCIQGTWFFFFNVLPFSQILLKPGPEIGG